MRTTSFNDAIRIRAEPDLRAALAEAAKAEKTSISEFTRRALRRIVAERAAPSCEKAA